MNTLCTRRVRVVGLVGLSLAAGLAGGCQLPSRFSVDVRNQSPQPLQVELIERDTYGNSFTRGSTRLGPGDRGGLGPFSAPASSIVEVAIDSKPNPRAPVLWTLRPGTNILEVRQQGDATAGPLEVKDLGSR